MIFPVGITTAILEVWSSGGNGGLFTIGPGGGGGGGAYFRATILVDPTLTYTITHTANSGSTQGTTSVYVTATPAIGVTLSNGQDGLVGSHGAGGAGGSVITNTLPTTANSTVSGSGQSGQNGFSGMGGNAYFCGVGGIGILITSGTPGQFPGGGGGDAQSGSPAPLGGNAFVVFTY